jgi:hypothetical protein
MPASQRKGSAAARPPNCPLMPFRRIVQMPVSRGEMVTAKATFPEGVVVTRPDSRSRNLRCSALRSASATPCPGTAVPAAPAAAAKAAAARAWAPPATWPPAAGSGGGLAVPQMVAKPGTSAAAQVAVIIFAAGVPALRSLAGWMKTEASTCTSAKWGKQEAEKGACCRVGMAACAAAMQALTLSRLPICGPERSVRAAASAASRAAAAAALAAAAAAPAAARAAAAVA